MEGVFGLHFTGFSLWFVVQGFYDGFDKVLRWVEVNRLGLSLCIWVGSVDVDVFKPYTYTEFQYNVCGSSMFLECYRSYFTCYLSKLEPPKKNNLKISTLSFLFLQFPFFSLQFLLFFSSKLQFLL